MRESRQMWNGWKNKLKKDAVGHIPDLALKIYAITKRPEKIKYITPRIIRLDPSKYKLFPNKPTNQNKINRDEWRWRPITKYPGFRYW